MKKFNPAPLVFITIIACSCGQQDVPPKEVPQSNINYKISKVSGIARIEPLNKLYNITPEVSGVVAKLYKHEGDTTRKGDPIIALAADVEQAQVNQSFSRLNTQQNQIAALNATLASQLVRLQKASDDYQRNRRLAAGGAQTEQELSASKSAYDSQLEDVNTSRSNYNEAKSKLTEFQKDIAYNQELVNRRTIKAPANGLIISLDVRPGSGISANQSIGEFAPSGPLMAITEIDELFASKIKPGQRGFVLSQGTSDTLAFGIVTYVAPSLKKKSLFSDQSENLEDRRVREIHLQLSTSTNVLIGSRVDCVINLR